MEETASRPTDGGAVPTPVSPPERAALPHYAYIDALRGLAFLGVVGVHSLDAMVWTAGLTQSLPGWITPIVIDGRMGVQLFFVISAFTLMLSLNTRKRREEAPVTNFFIRRFFRIAPLFYLAVLFYTPLNQVVYFHQHLLAPEGVHWWHILAALLFVNGWYPTTFNSVTPGGWSVAVEMSFYVLVPFLVARLTTLRRTLIVTVAAIVAALAVNGEMMRLLGPSWSGEYDSPFRAFLDQWLIAELPVFFMGFVLYHLIQRDRLANHSPAENRRKAGGLLALTAVCLLIGIYAAGPLSLLSRYFFGVAFASLAFALSLVPFKLFVNPILGYVGKISYSCYLLHFFFVYVIVLAIARRVIAHVHHPVSPLVALPVFYAASVLLTVAFASLTYRFVEEPGIAWGRRLIAANEKRLAASAQARQKLAI